MNKWICAVLAAVITAGLCASVRAEGGKDANAVLDKAIKALGGAEKLMGSRKSWWKAKGTISIGGEENKFGSQTTVEAPQHYRNDFEGEFGGNKISGSTVLSGDNGWIKFGDMVTTLDKDGLANQKRNVYLSLVPAIILPLKSDRFKVESVAADKVDGKPATALKCKGPDGKAFTICFSNETGLPVKATAPKVAGFQGDEEDQEWTFSDYKDFDGVKRATKIVIKRGGEKFMTQEVVEFKVLPTVDAKTFAEPK